MDDDTVSETPVKIPKLVLSLAKAIGEFPAVPFDDANCQGSDTNIFENHGGIPTLRAFNYCGGCAIRLEHLDADLRKGAVHLITGGFAGRSTKRIIDLMKLKGLSNIPQLDVVPTQFHFDFMAHLYGVQEFYKKEQRSPRLGEQIIFAPGTKIPMANAKSYEIFEPIILDVGTWYTSISNKSNPLRVIFQYELVDAGYFGSDNISYVAKYKSAYALWRNRNPKATLFPLDTKIRLERGCYVFDGNGRPFTIDSPELLMIGKFFARELGIDPESQAFIPISEMEQKLKIDGTNSKTTISNTIQFESITDLNFDIFLAAFNIWKEKENEFEFVAFTDTVQLNRDQIGEDILQLLNIDSKSKSFKIEVGFIADKIRNGELKITKQQYSKLANIGFIFDVDDFILARNIAVAKAWVKSNPGKYLSLGALPKDSEANQPIVLKAGTKITLGSGVKYTLRIDNAKEPLAAYKSLQKSHSYGSLPLNVVEDLEKIGVIWSIEDFKKGVLHKVGLYPQSSSQGRPKKQVLSEARLKEIAQYKKISNGSTSREVLELKKGTVIDTPTGEKYVLKHPVYVDMKAKRVYFDRDEALGIVIIPEANNSAPLAQAIAISTPTLPVNS